MAQNIANGKTGRISQFVSWHFDTKQPFDKDQDDPFNDNFDPFNDAVLSIMTQRNTTESLSPVNKFWSQHELFPSQPTIILDTEQEEPIDDEFVSVNQLTDIFAGEDVQFLQDYHSAVNDSVEILLGPE